MYITYLLIILKLGYRRCVNRAGRRVVFIDRYEDRTVYHDFFSQFGSSRLFVQQKPPGHGVSAHRLIRAACELVGIKDLRVTIEGKKYVKINEEKIVKQCPKKSLTHAAFLTTLR